MLASTQLEQLARLEGRSPTNVLHRIILSALHDKLANGAADIPADIDLEEGAGRFICLKIKPMQKAAIKTFAEREDRSVANAMRVLLRDGLHANGVTVKRRVAAAGRQSDAILPLT